MAANLSNGGWQDAELSKFMGTWRITDCAASSSSTTLDADGIVGCEFTLNDSGDVSWKVTDDIEVMPFFSSDAYAIFFKGRRNCEVLASIKFFGTLSEEIIEFDADFCDDLMLLKCEKCCMLTCQKVSQNSKAVDVPYFLGKALAEGFFSDLTIKSENGTEYHVHQLILQMAAPSLTWTKSRSPLHGLPGDVVHTILYYLYNQCLAPGLSEATIHQCLKYAKKINSLEGFVTVCQTFLKNTALKKHIEDLMGDIETSTERILDLVKCKGGSDSVVPPTDVLANNPSRLCFVVKQALKEGIIAGSKFVVLCDMFAHRSGELPQKERHEVIKIARSRLPGFMKKLQEILTALEHQMSFIGDEQKREIAVCLVPEIDSLHDMLDGLAEVSVDALVAIKKSLTEKEQQTHKKKEVKDVLGKTLKQALHVRELMKLKGLYESISVKFSTLIQKLERFKSRSQAEKVKKMCVIIDELKYREVPMLLGRVKSMGIFLEEKIKWRDWKYVFKLVTSKVAWGVNKLYNYRDVLSPSVKRILSFIGRDEFTNSVQALGLCGVEADKLAAAASGAESSTHSKYQRSNVYAKSIDLESLCVPPNAKENPLATAVLKLLKEGTGADMVFEIIPSPETVDTEDIIIDHTTSPLAANDKSNDQDTTSNVYEIRAHRVILAARCDWFKRALLSGMREAIDKKITIHGTSPEIFQLFLEFLYSGQLVAENQTAEQLSDLLTLADQYEVDSLKHFCEHALQNHINSDTALYLLSLADHLQTMTLKDRCMSYLVENPAVAEADDFREIPQQLRQEVSSALSEKTDKPIVQPKKKTQEFGLDYDEDSDDSDCAIEPPSQLLMTRLRLHRDSSSSSSSGELNFENQLQGNDVKMAECMEALREVLGPEPSDQALRTLIISADYDVNRAVNFFWGS